jgi:hypothetical protein
MSFALLAQIETLRGRFDLQYFQRRIEGEERRRQAAEPVG